MCRIFIFIGNLVLTLFVVSVPSVNGQKGFCQSFVENGNSVDYGFQYHPLLNDYYLIIGQSYWKVIWDNDDHSARIESLLNGRTSSLFGSQYRTVFSGNCSVCSPNTVSHKIGRLHKTNGTIEWTFIKRNNMALDEKLMANASVDPSITGPITTQINFEANFNPTIGFLDQNNVVFVEQKGSKTPVTTPKGNERHRRDTNGLLFMWYNFNDQNGDRFVDKKELASVSLQQIAIFYASVPSTISYLGYLSILKDDKTIKYCESVSIKSVCTPSTNETLIDCSDYISNETNNISEEEMTIPSWFSTESDANSMSAYSWLKLIVIIILVISGVIFVVSLIYYFIKKGSTNRGSTSSADKKEEV